MIDKHYHRKKIKEGSRNLKYDFNDTFDMSTNMTFSCAVDKLKLLVGELDKV